MFDSSLPEEWISIITNFYKALMGNGTYIPVSKIGFLHKILHVEDL